MPDDLHKMVLRADLQRRTSEQREARAKADEKVKREREARRTEMRSEPLPTERDMFVSGRRHGKTKLLFEWVAKELSRKGEISAEQIARELKDPPKSLKGLLAAAQQGAKGTGKGQYCGLCLHLATEVCPGCNGSSHYTNRETVERPAYLQDYIDRHKEPAAAQQEPLNCQDCVTLGCRSRGVYKSADGCKGYKTRQPTDDAPARSIMGQVYEAMLARDAAAEQQKPPDDFDYDRQEMQCTRSKIIVQRWGVAEYHINIAREQGLSYSTQTRTDDLRDFLKRVLRMLEK